MKIVIEIPEDSYKATCVGCMLPSDVENVVQAIKNGTPLPKCHGDLKDADIYKTEVKKYIAENKNSDDLYLLKKSKMGRG